MAKNKGEGEGEAQDAEVVSTPSGEESPEEHEANIRANLLEAADAVVASAEVMMEKAKAQVAAAEESLKKAQAHRAEVGEE